VKNYAGKAAPNVDVLVFRPQATSEPRSAATDQLGGYVLYDLEPGEYSVSFSFPGSPSVSRTVEIEPGPAAKIDITMDIQFPGVRNWLLRD
jgi:hypothetical protein